MARETNTPQIPQVTDDNLVEVVRTLKEIVEVREGRRGDDLDEAVTYRDLVMLGLVKKLANGGYGDNTGTTDLPVVTPVDDSNIPPAPTNLTVKAVYNIIVLGWTVPSYRNHGVTEVWRAKVDDLTKAVKVGDTAGTQFTDPPGDSATYWYWVRNVSTAGVAGPYNSQAGTSATAQASVADILADIAAELENSALVRDLRSRVESLEDGTFVPKYINDTVIRAEELARESRTLVTRTNGNLAYVQQVMETVSGMKAKYTLKLGVGGHIAGFGMAIEPNAVGTYTSEFIVSADRFAIVPPSVSSSTAPSSNLYLGMVWVDTSVTPNVTKYYTGSGWSTSQAYAQLPFTVYTSPGTTPSGRTIQPGVYMKGAFIEELAADKITAGAISVAISMTAAKIMGGQFTSYGWPSTAGGGYYLGSEGLMLGTYNVSIPATSMVAGKMYRVKTVGSTDFTTVGGTNTVGASFKATGTPSGSGTVALESFFQIQSDGNMYAPGMSMVDGVLTIAQLNVIDTGQLFANAVTLPMTASAAPGDNHADNAQDLVLQTATSYFSSGATVSVIVQMTVYYAGGSGVQCWAELYNPDTAGSVYAFSDLGANFTQSGSVVFAGFASITAAGNWKVRVYMGGGSGHTIRLDYVSVHAMGAKR